jgi:hypothetical protein
MAHRFSVYRKACFCSGPLPSHDEKETHVHTTHPPPGVAGYPAPEVLPAPAADSAELQRMHEAIGCSRCR